VLQLGLEQDVAWDLYKQLWYRVLKTVMSYPRRVSLQNIVLDFSRGWCGSSLLSMKMFAQVVWQLFFATEVKCCLIHTTCLSCRTYVVLICLLHIFDLVCRATYAQIWIV
jgi:hypothetical protein